MAINTSVIIWHLSQMLARLFLYKTIKAFTAKRLNICFQSFIVMLGWHTALHRGNKYLGYFHHFVIYEEL